MLVALIIAICQKVTNKVLIHKYTIFVIYIHRHFYFYHIYITFKKNTFFVTDYIWSEGELWQNSIKLL